MSEPTGSQTVVIWRFQFYIDNYFDTNTWHVNIKKIILLKLILVWRLY